MDNCNNKHSRQVEDDDGLKVVSLSSDGSLDTNDSFNSHHHHPLNHQDAIGGLVGIQSSNGNGNSSNTGVGGIHPSSHNMTIPGLNNQQQQRRRRKLPEIPKNKKCEYICLDRCITAFRVPVHISLTYM